MSFWRSTAFFVFSLLWSLPLRAEVASDGEVSAHRAALELAGAFSNDGFKLRDGIYCGTIKPKQVVIVQVNLYGGNQYWFTVGATSQTKKMSVTLYDETGKTLATEPYQQDALAAAGFTPTTSGPYYVRIEELEGEPASFCFLYSYK